MNGTAVEHPPTEVTGERGARRLPSIGRGLLLFLLTIPAAVLFGLGIGFVTLVPFGLGIFLVPPTLLALRSLTNLNRRLSAEWSGVPIAVPYRPLPDGTGVTGRWQRTRVMLTEAATWRDLLWALLTPAVGGLLACMPFALVGNGLHGVLMPWLYDIAYRNVDSQWYTFIPVDGMDRAWLCVPWGLAQIALGILLAPWFLRVHGLFTRSLLAPTAEAELALRVRHLTESRSDAVDASAAELRRIERDLHDGAQARLVAMGMNLGAAEHLMATDPDAARALLAETREASAKALHELRDLVRGIHPPVLSDRGLGDAVRAIALESPLDVDVHVDLPGRLEAPLESAAYFAVTEILTNAAKHSGATHVSIDLRRGHDRLRITVTDDGRGGADLAKGTGLRGIERRLGTFDGTLAIHSPEGGPTVVTMELPCTPAGS